MPQNLKIYAGSKNPVAFKIHAVVSLSNFEQSCVRHEPSDVRSTTDLQSCYVNHFAPQLKHGDFHAHVRNDVIRFRCRSGKSCMYVPQVSHKPYRTFMLGHYVCQTNFFNRINFFSCLDLSDRNKTCLPSPPESLTQLAH